MMKMNGSKCMTISPNPSLEKRGIVKTHQVGNNEITWPRLFTGRVKRQYMWLFVVSPHANDFNRLVFFDDLVDQTVLYINTAGISTR